MYWRLFEEKDGNLHTLFHGLGGSRLIPEGHWLEALIKPVRDGANQERYDSGWHVFADESGLEYLGRFRNPRRLVAVQVEARCLRPKPTNPSILLAQWMRVPEGAPRRIVKDVQ
ncbi:MAG: hypothetical protein LC650_00595 [Actinobacteria bacterium]|nr:hypothetical protein [Actinomycetota bacterium]